MSNYSFIFDVETTGLFTRKRGEKVDFRKLVNFDNCRIVSISWIIIDSNEKDTIIEKKNFPITILQEQDLIIQGLVNH